MFSAAFGVRLNAVMQVCALCYQSLARLSTSVWPCPVTILTSRRTKGGSCESARRRSRHHFSSRYPATSKGGGLR
eukprot:3880348-Lingulodinium_polyedra.AAC.1